MKHKKDIITCFFYYITSKENEIHKDQGSW